MLPATASKIVRIALCFAFAAALAQSSTKEARQGTADLGLDPNGVRIGPGMNAATAGDESYHNDAVPGRKRVLVWIDVSNGYQHDSVSHAAATIERLGYETGTYDTFIRSDSQLITKHPVLCHDGAPLLYAKMRTPRSKWRQSRKACLPWSAMKLG
jgi:hypothetical protein